MKQENRLKHIEIVGEFRTFEELRTALGAILSMASGGTEQYKEVRDGTRFEYDMSYCEEPDYRHEIIGGKPCIVIQSKINK